MENPTKQRRHLYATEITDSSQIFKNEDLVQILNHCGDSVLASSYQYDIYINQEVINSVKWIK